MAYRQLGFLDWNQAKAEGVSIATETNQRAVDTLLERMEVPSKFAGPLSTAEQQAFSMVLESGAAGKLPPPGQVKNVIAGLGTGLATAALATPCGPAAPLCGAAAGFIVSKLTGAIFGSGGSGCTINGVDCTQWTNETERRGVESCPPGDEACKKDIRFTVQEWATRRQVAQNAKIRFDQECKPYEYNIPFNSLPDHCFPGCSGTFLQKAACKNPANRKPPPMGPLVEELQSAIARRAMIARYAAEHAFMQRVDVESKAILSKIEPQCGPSSGCRSQVQGVILEGVYQSAKELRSPIGGRVGAQKIMQAARLQAEGAIAQSRAIQAQAEGLKKQEAARASDQYEEEAERESARRTVILIAGVLAAGAVAYTVWRKH